MPTVTSYSSRIFRSPRCQLRTEMPMLVELRLPGLVGRQLPHPGEGDRALDRTQERFRITRLQ